MIERRDWQMAFLRLLKYIEYFLVEFEKLFLD